MLKLLSSLKRSLLQLKGACYVGVMLCLPCTALAAVHWQAPDYILQSFLEVALKNEFNLDKSPVRKWQAPIKVKMVYEYPGAQRYLHLVNKHLLHLNAITQHPIYSAPNQANLTIILTTENRWDQVYLKEFDQQTQKRMQTTVCMGRMQLNRHYQITGGVVVIPVDKAIRHRKLVTCIVEELTQIMGLPNDSERVYPSIFNDKTPNDLLTGLDYLLLKLLYQPAVKQGMDANRITQVAKPILLQWQQQGVIASAQQQVRSGALYPLLGY